MGSLLDTPEIAAIENNFISLFDRTIKKALNGTPGPKLKLAVKRQFGSKTFEVQLDKLIDRNYIYTVKHTDKELVNVLGASSYSPSKARYLEAGSKQRKNALVLTEEAVRQAQGLSDDITESIIRTLKDESIYLEHPHKMAKRVMELWGGEKHRAVRWCRTFNCDVATNTALYRFKEQGIEECQFTAHLDERTSPQCRMLNGTIFKVGSPEAQRYRCPLHYHCRSFLAAVAYPEKYPDKLRYENRDFTKPFDHHSKKAIEPFEKEFVDKIMKDIKEFRTKWAIPQFILDEDVEIRLAKLGLRADIFIKDTEKKAKQATPTFKTTKEAENWVLKNTAVKNVDFYGWDIDVANEMVQAYKRHVALDPSLKDMIGFLGSGHTQQDLWYHNRLAYYMQKFMDMNSQEKALEMAKQVVKRMPDMTAYAHWWNLADIPELRGIAINLDYAKDKAKFVKQLQSDLKVAWHPEHCDTVKAVIDHEFGHAIDSKHGITKSGVLKEQFDSLSVTDMQLNLSRYAATNEAEFLAEAWSEYLNNPNPRPIAKRVGSLISQKINKSKS